MPVSSEPTPNPNAMKFTVGEPVGGPATFTTDGEVDDPTAAQLLDIEGVVSVFMTADFVTVTKSAEADWETITPQAVAALESRFG
ncbi:MAG: NifU N-terminal domain-containing protein [Actinomycetota bacterium]